MTLGDAFIASPGAARRLERVAVPRLPGYGRDSSLLLWSWLLWDLGQGLWAYLWPIHLASLGASAVEIGFVVATGPITATLCYVPGGYVALLGRHKWQLAIGHLLPIGAVASFALAREWWHVLPGMIGIMLGGARRAGQPEGEGAAPSHYVTGEAPVESALTRSGHIIRPGHALCRPSGVGRLRERGRCAVETRA